MKTNRKTVWVCMACGKRSDDLYGDNPIDMGWDVSCALHAVLCYEDSLEFKKDGTVRRAVAKKQQRADP